MAYKIETYHNDNIIIYTHHGDVTKDEIGNAWNEMLQIPEFTIGKYNLLTDYREGKSQIKTDELSEIIEILSKIKPIIRGKKQAFLVHEPIGTAITLMFETEVFEKTGFLCKTFVTNEAAIKWLKE